MKKLFQKICRKLAEKEIKEVAYRAELNHERAIMLLKETFKDQIDKVKAEVFEEARIKAWDEVESHAEKRAEKIARDLFSAEHLVINPQNVMYVSEGGIVSLNREALTLEEKKRMKEEVRWLVESRIWQIFQETIKQKAIEKSIFQSTDWEQVLAGKMMLYNLRIMQDIVDSIAKIKM